MMLSLEALLINCVFALIPYNFFMTLCTKTSSLSNYLHHTRLYKLHKT